MSAYLVVTLSEPHTAPLSFEDLGGAVEWCRQNAGRGRFKVVEVPNAHGALPVVNVAALKAVWAS